MATGRALPGADAGASVRRASGARRGRSSEDERAALEEERAMRRRVRAWRGERQCRRREARGRRDHRRPSGRRRRLHLRDARARGRRLSGRTAAGRDGARPLVLAPLLLLTAAGRRRRARRQARAHARGGEEDGREGGCHARRARPKHGAIVPGWIRAVKPRALRARERDAELGLVGLRALSLAPPRHRCSTPRPGMIFLLCKRFGLPAVSTKRRWGDEVVEVRFGMVVCVSVR